MSLSEKLAQKVNVSAFSKATDLQKRLLFTFGVLIVCRLGSFIPLPGIDPVILDDVFSRHSDGILGMFNVFSGGALSRMSIFALNIMPYISASIIIQLGSSILPSLMALKKEGESGQRKITQYTRYLTVLIAVVQGYVIAVTTEGMIGSSGGSAVVTPGLMFRATTVVSLLGGTMFIVWLGEQITSRGIGNGSSLIICSGIIAGIPGALARTLELGREGQLSVLKILVLGVMIVAVVYLVVLFERSQRRVNIQYPKRQVGGRMMGGEASHLPLKLNPTGVIPPIFAGSILLLPMSIVNMSFGRGEEAAPDWLASLSAMLTHGHPVYLTLYASLIIFFTFFYTAIVFNPEETAKNLKQHGGFVAGIRPGKSTADYFDYILTRLSAVGAIYLASLCVFPEILMSKAGVPFFLGGTSLLIVVSVIMDFMTQIQSYLLAHQYEGLIRKARIKGYMK